MNIEDIKMKYLIIWVSKIDGFNHILRTSYDEVENYEKLIAWLKVNNHLQVVQILEVSK